MKHIIVVFKNNIQVEGNLQSLEDNEMVLQSLDGITSIIIPDIKDSILFYKINSSKDEFEDIAKKTNKTQEDLEQLVAIKGNLINIERSTIREKLQAPIKKDQYVSRNEPFPRSVKYPEKKTTGTNNNFASGLQGLFSKKY